MNPLSLAVGQAIGSMYGSNSGPIHFVPMTDAQQSSLINLMIVGAIALAGLFYWMHKSVNKNPDLWLPRREFRE